MANSEIVLPIEERIKSLKRLALALEEELDCRETSVPGEIDWPECIRGRELYFAVKDVERHYGGKLPLGPWQAWRGMLRRADEDDGEEDLHCRFERYYELGDELLSWSQAEILRSEASRGEIDSIHRLELPGANCGTGNSKVMRLAKSGRGNQTIRSKRSTQKGDAQIKLIAALTKHHKYADGSCLNPDPIGNNDLARMAGVAKRSASAFFQRKFDGYSNYRIQCNTPQILFASLKALNADFSPRDFNSARTPDEFVDEAE